MKKVRCNLCDSIDEKLIYTCKMWDLSSSEEFRLVRCNNCGLAFLNPRPKKEEIEKYYPDEYYVPGEQNEPYSFLKPRRVKLIMRHEKSGRILDIGSQRGDFLLAMGKEDFDPYGVELSELACKYAKKAGLKNILQGDIENMKLPNGFFHVVTLWNVLEHIHNPKLLLSRIHKSMLKDGLLVIEVPNFASLQRRIYRDKWYALDVPRHLYQFTQKTLIRSIETTGFRVIKRSHLNNLYINFVSFKLSLLRTFGLVKYIPNRRIEDDKILRKRLFREILKLFFNWFCIIFSFILACLKSSDIITIYSRKE